MQIFVIILSIILGSIGVYLFYSSNRQLGDIPKTAEPVPMSQVLKIALMYGVASVLLSFAMFTIFGTIVDNKAKWTFQGLLVLSELSVAIGVIFFLGSIYQVRWTVKYRDHLIDKYKAKK